MRKGCFKLERIDNYKSNFVYTCNIPFNNDYQLLIVYNGIVDITLRKDFNIIDKIIQSSFRSYNNFDIDICLLLLRRLFLGIDEKILYITVINVRDNILCSRLRFEEKKLVTYINKQDSLSKNINKKYYVKK